MVEPENIKIEFEKVEDENWMFRAFLKGIDDVDELDRLVNSMHKELFENYDCAKCGNCCKDTSPVLKNKDIKRIADYLNEKVDNFKDIYLEKSSEGFIFKGNKCIYFKDNKCEIYNKRPKSCRDYPYTNKDEIWSRLINLVHNSEICPVVFEIFERLKKYYKDEFGKYKIEYKKVWGDFK